MSEVQARAADKMKRLQVLVDQERWAEALPVAEDVARDWQRRDMARRMVLRGY